MTKPNPYRVVRRYQTKPYMYDALCLLCPYVSRAWDWRRNALSDIRHHVAEKHGEVRA